LLWRLGRKIYALARGDGTNDPSTNGEYWFLQHVLRVAPLGVILDVGANRGDWTAQALKFANAHIHVHAFEPSQATRSMLSGRFRENAAVTVHPYAVSDSVGQATFFCGQDGAGTNSLSAISGKHGEVVPVTTVDEFIRCAKLDQIDMVKIDTEGFDFLVLKGARSALTAGLIEVIQFEYNWRWLLNHASLRDVFDFVSGKPYRIGKLVGRSIELYREWHFELDRYFENNYVLIRRDSDLLRLGVEVGFDKSDSVITFSSPP